jgi:hypothetical protein
MSALDPHMPESCATSAHETSANTPAAPEVNGSLGTEHKPEPQPAPAAAEPSSAEPSRVERAEVMVDHIATSVSDFTSRWGRRVVRVFARIKEEAEDIWSEAQSIRRGDQP